MTDTTRNVDAIKVDNFIELLKQFIKDASIDPLIAILEALKQDPNNESLLLSYDLFENNRK